MAQLHAIHTKSQKNMKFCKTSDDEEKLLSQLLGIVEDDCEKTSENLSLFVDNRINISLRAVLDSILLRAKTQQTEEELLKYEKTVNVLFKRWEVDKSNDKLKIWFLGHLSAQLDILALLEKTLELDVDMRLVDAVNADEHAYSILSTLYSQPQLSWGKLEQKAGLESDVLSKILNKMTEYQLVFSDKHGQEQYYTLTANGKKVFKHLEHRVCGLTPDILTIIIKELITSFQQVYHGQLSSKEAVKRFRLIVEKHTHNFRELECLVREPMNFMSSKKPEFLLNNDVFWTEFDTLPHIDRDNENVYFYSIVNSAELYEGKTIPLEFSDLSTKPFEKKLRWRTINSFNHVDNIKRDEEINNVNDLLRDVVLDSDHKLRTRLRY